MTQIEKMNRLKTFFALSVTVWFNLNCSNNGQLSNQENKIKEEHKLPINEAGMSLSCFEETFFNELDSIGYSTLETENIELNDSTRKQINFLITRSSKSNYLPFVDSILTNELYTIYPSKQNYPVKNSSGFYPNTLQAYKWQFPNRDILKLIQNDYDSLMNLNLQPASMVYYDYNCSSIWFFTNVQGQVTIDFLKIGELLH
jgi:hypothetical protein